MRQLAIVLLVLALPLAAAADKAAKPAAKKYRGATVSVDVKQAELSDIVRLLADVSMANMVLIDVPSTKVDLKVVNRPWDETLDDLLVTSKLELVRTGSLFLIGQPAWIAERKKQAKPRVYREATMDLDVKDADALAVSTLISVATGKPFGVQPGRSRRVALLLKRMPADQAFEVVLAQSGASAVDKPAITPAPGTACVAPGLELAGLTLEAIAGIGTKRFALLVDAKQTPYVVTKGTCVGATKAKVKDVGQGYVTYEVGGVEQSTELQPPTP